MQTPEILQHILYFLNFREFLLNYHRNSVIVLYPK